MKKPTVHKLDQIPTGITKNQHQRQISDGIFSKLLFKITIKQPGQYVLNITLKGYQPYCDTINIKKIKAKPIINLPDILLKKTPKVRQLGAAVVKSSRVKFYHKGDTLIFDADAFNTADGSMLDALIRQLPGVELKSNGQILVNGRLVESLLLNGEYFFICIREIGFRQTEAYLGQFLPEMCRHTGKSCW